MRVKEILEARYFAEIHPMKMIGRSMVLLAGVLDVQDQDTLVFTLRQATLWTGSWRPWLTMPSFF